MEAADAKTVKKETEKKKTVKKETQKKETVKKKKLYKNPWVITGVLLVSHVAVAAAAYIIGKNSGEESDDNGEDANIDVE